MGRETIQGWTTGHLKMKVSGYADDGLSQKSRKAPRRVGESLLESGELLEQGQGGGQSSEAQRKSVRPGPRTIP